MRIWPCAVLLAALAPLPSPAAAGDDAPYYGPMKRWHGIGYKFGYEDRTEPDGSWRIDVAIHGRGEAVDMALYRAAERARDEGYRYLFLLGGRGRRSPGVDAATLYARPSREAVAPVGCRPGPKTSCYTASVAELLRILGGPGGTQPGVAIVDHRDRYGRAVILSGYGTGAVGTGAAAAAIPPAVRSAGATPSPVAVRAPRATDRVATANGGETARRADERFDRAYQANKPVRGGDAKLGWTISD